jgi:transposase-like protein
MARPSYLDQPEHVKAVGEAFANGLSRAQMCETFGVSDPDTITRWRRDPRVKAVALKAVEARVLEVTRKVDSSIAARLENPENMTVDELLKIRKEFLGGALRAQTEKADEDTIAEAQDWLEENPDAADELEKLLSNPKKIPGTGVVTDTRAPVAALTEG